MSLRVWLPLDGDLRNQGISNSNNIISTGSSVVNTGKIGKCMKITSNTDLQYTPNFNQYGLSLSGWFKINQNEVATVVDALGTGKKFDGAAFTSGMFTIDANKDLETRARPTVAALNQSPSTLGASLAGASDSYALIRTSDVLCALYEDPNGTEDEGFIGMASCDLKLEELEQ